MDFSRSSHCNYLMLQRVNFGLRMWFRLMYTSLCMYSGVSTGLGPTVSLHIVVKTEYSVSSYHSSWEIYTSSSHRKIVWWANRRMAKRIHDLETRKWEMERWRKKWKSRTKGKSRIVLPDAAVGWVDGENNKRWINVKLQVYIHSLEIE